MKITVISNVYVQKLKNQSAAHKIIADFVLDLLTSSVIQYAIMQNYNITII